MQRLKLALSCALLAALTGLAVQAVLLLHAATCATRALPVAVSAEVKATRVALLGQVSRVLDGDPESGTPEGTTPLRELVLSQIDDQLTALQANAGKQVTALRTDVMTRLDKIEGDANARVGDSLARVDTALGVADKRLGDIAGTAEALRQDAKPAMVNSAALVQDLKDSLDDNYDDIKATIGSSTVAVTGVARAAEAVGNAAPSITASVDSVAKSAAKEADQITKPQSFWQGLKSWMLIVSRCAGFFF
jgi:hypothetical protein